MGISLQIGIWEDSKNLFMLYRPSISFQDCRSPYSALESGCQLWGLVGDYLALWSHHGFYLGRFPLCCPFPRVGGGGAGACRGQEVQQQVGLANWSLHCWSFLPRSCNWSLNESLRAAQLDRGMWTFENFLCWVLPTFDKQICNSSVEV